MLINPNTICSIKIHVNEICSTYKFKKPLFRKEGFYDFFNDEFTPIDFIKKQNLQIKDNKIFYKPHIEISLANQNTLKKFFESEEELQTYLLYFKDYITIE